jgi:hypothetical protein
LGRAASGTEAKLGFYYALARAANPALIDQAISIALTDEMSNGRVNRFLQTLAENADDPGRVWNGVLAIHEKVIAKLSEDMANGFLPGIATPTADPAVARVLDALPESKANSGSAIQTRKAVEMIDWRAAFNAGLRPRVAAWLRGIPE